MITLGIDYGEARIGVAVSQGSLADPVAVINNDRRAIERVKKLAQEYKADLIVVGIAKKAKEFADKLGLKVAFHDETLSSKTALEHLKHKSKSFRVKPQDAYQAAVMLQDWLDGRE